MHHHSLDYIYRRLEEARWPDIHDNNSGWCSMMLHASPNDIYLRRYARALEQQQNYYLTWYIAAAAVATRESISLWRRMQSYYVQLL